MTRSVNRREFLAGSAAAALWASVWPIVVVAANSEPIAEQIPYVIAFAMFVVRRSFASGVIRRNRLPACVKSSDVPRSS